jgi:hypothetical protein
VNILHCIAVRRQGRFRLERGWDWGAHVLEYVILSIVNARRIGGDDF